MRPQIQDALIRWTPKCRSTFVLIEEPTPRSAYRGFNFAALIARADADAHP
jgi:hypothetical protein